MGDNTSSTDAVWRELTAIYAHPAGANLDPDGDTWQRALAIKCAARTVQPAERWQPIIERFANVGLPREQIEAVCLSSSAPGWAAVVLGLIDCGKTLAPGDPVADTGRGL